MWSEVYGRWRMLLTYCRDFGRFHYFVFFFLKRSHFTVVTPPQNDEITEEPRIHSVSGGGHKLQWGWSLREAKKKKRKKEKKTRHKPTSARCTGRTSHFGPSVKFGKRNRKWLLLVCRRDALGIKRKDLDVLQCATFDTPASSSFWNVRPAPHISQTANTGLKKKNNKKKKTYMR